MNAPKLDQPGLLDVSPVLETGSPTPLSTHWIPLHELIAHWTRLGPLLTPDPDALLLTAIGHALFALSRETHALRLSTLAWQQQQHVRKRYGRQPEPNHQQGSSFGTHPADKPYDSDSFDVEGADYPGEPVHPPSSAVRRPTVPSRQRETVSFQSPQPKPTRVFRRVDRATLVIWLSLALIVMVGGWWLLSTAASWWQGVSDDWKYGTPRTFQVDQFVGQVIVVQLNPQHPRLDHIYGITTVSDPHVPVSLSFRPTGTTWAMYVIIGDTNPYSVELVSDGKQFVSPH